jgi:hypothetical protein
MSRRIPHGFAGSNMRMFEYLVNGFRILANESGRATGVTSNSIINSSKNWTTNQWSGKTVTIGTNNGPTTATISSNTATTLTVGSWSNGAPSTTAKADDGTPLLYEIQSGHKIAKVVVNGTKGSSTLTLTDLTGFTANTKYYVTGNGIPAFYTGSSVTIKETSATSAYHYAANSNSSALTTNYTSVTTPSSLTGTILTLSTPLLNDINNATINFYLDQTSIEYQIDLMACAGIESCRTAYAWSDIEISPPYGGINSTGTVTTNNSGQYVLTDLSANWPTGSTNLIGNTLIIGPDIKNQISLNAEGKIVANTATTITIESLNGYGYPFSGSYQYIITGNSVPHIYNFINGGELSSTYQKHDFDTFSMLMSKNGIQLMPHVDALPYWEIDPIYGSRTAFSPISLDIIADGSNYIAIKNNTYDSFDHNLNKAFAVFYNMIVKGPNVPTGTKIGDFETTSQIVFNGNTLTIVKENVQNALRKSTDETYLLKLNNNLPAGNYNITVDIANYVSNNTLISTGKLPKNPFDETLIFDNIYDVIAATGQAKKKGGLPPKKYNNFVDFMNVLVNRYGTNGVFWKSANNLWARSIQKTVTASTTGQKTLTVSNGDKLSVGMLIESNVYGSGTTAVPATSSNGNLAYIPLNTKILSINGNQITLSNNLNRDIPTGATVIFKFPPITNWQIYNEVPYPTSDNLFWKITSSGITHKINIYKYGNNWPQYPTAMDVPTTSGSSYKSNLSTFVSGWGESYLKFIEKIKAEVHSIDANAQIVTSALNIKANTLSSTFFNSQNAKNKFDKIAFNMYPSPQNQQDDIIKALETEYGVNTTNYNPTPNVIISEYGWSTAVGVVPSNQWPNPVSFNAQKSYLADFFDKTWSSKNTNSVRVFVNNGHSVNFEFLMFFKWASDEGHMIQNQTGGSGSPFLDYWRSPSFYTTSYTNSSPPPANINQLNFYSKPSAKAYQDGALTLQGRM